MKQWLSAHILSSEDFTSEDMSPMSNKEFYISISMLVIALALYGIIIHVFGA
jgi:hypothetical protein